MKNWKYIPEENRYVLNNGAPDDAPPLDNPVFNQAAVLHTSEDVPINLTRAYNVDDQIVFTDRQVKWGANSRGQDVGDSSAPFLPDQIPEDGE